uniref:Uncharacterized protein n=1 Tax=Tanacetum cinerariifolium TaxID=118510 RepID=A0A6L2MFC2_TANCI|nr:hypothetical protein [Tanacetum cinerariifolium]GEV77422.1 hypothetical protein [Tanacetum cinerariifolium]
MRGGYGVRARVNDLPVDPNDSRLNCVFMNRLGWLGFFYAGIIGFLAFITSAAEHYSDKFIKTHWLKIQVASILAICGFLSLLGYLTLVETELGDYAKKLRTFLGLIGIYLSYAGLVIWGVGVFAHGSTVLQIILWSLLLGLPIIGIMELENIIHRYEDDQPLGEADQELVARVFEHHPQKADKLDGSQIKHFTVACHGFSEEVRSFYLVLKNGKKTQFSYNTCVRSYVQRRYREEAEAFWKKYRKNRRSKSS